MDKSTKGLLVLGVVLLAANLVATAWRPASQPAAALLPTASAGTIVVLEGQRTFATTNQEGNVLYIWQTGKFVNGRYEDVQVDGYSAGR